MKTTFGKIWFTPMFSTLLTNRTESLALVGVGVLQVGLQLLGLPGWTCPFKAVFGIPCPGCGLTAAIDELLHGQVRAALHTHAFAPIFLVAFLVLLVVVMLPKTMQIRLAEAVARVEIRTGIAAWVLSGLMLYWVFRLFGFL
jgi:hypothetical protein